MIRIIMIRINEYEPSCLFFLILSLVKTFVVDNQAQLPLTVTRLLKCLIEIDEDLERYRTDFRHTLFMLLFSVLFQFPTHARFSSEIFCRWISKKKISSINWLIKTDSSNRLIFAMSDNKCEQLKWRYLFVLCSIAINDKSLSVEEKERNNSNDRWCETTFEATSVERYKKKIY